MKSIKELSSMLSARAEDVCLMLLPGGKRVGDVWSVGDITGAPGKSLTVHLSGQYAGKWKDWSDSDLRGDLIDLWRTQKGLTPQEAIAQIRNYLGLPDAPRTQNPKTYRPGVVSGSDLTEGGAIYSYFMEKRKIRPETVNRFQIRGTKRKFREFGEKSVTAIVFPCVSPSGERVNTSYCALQRDEKGRKAVSQDTGAAPCLFGWHALSDGAYTRRAVVICEGQIDCMTWTQWGFDCLSVPAGSGLTWLEYEWDNLDVFTTIYVSFDMDQKTADSRAKVVERLGRHRCMIVELPHKDANDCLKAGCTSEDAKKWIRDAKAPVMPFMVTAGTMKQRLLDEFYPPADSEATLRIGMLNGRDNDHSFKIRPGELTVWTGISSHGKSAFLNAILADIVQKHRCFIASYEVRAQRTLRNIVRCMSGIEFPSPQWIDDFIHQAGDNICFLDRVGYGSQKELIEMMEFAFCRYGVTQFFIDSMMRIDDLEEDYPAQGKFLNLLASFALNHCVHVHLVAHPRKTPEDGRPSGADIKGASLIRNNAHNILIVYRNTKKENAVAEGEMSEEEAANEWDTNVVVDKDREEGLKKVFYYKYVHKTGRFDRMDYTPTKKKK